MSSMGQLEKAPSKNASTTTHMGPFPSLLFFSLGIKNKANDSIDGSKMKARVRKSRTLGVYKDMS